MEPFTYFSLLPKDVRNIVDKYKKEEIKRNKQILECLFAMFDGNNYGGYGAMESKNRLNKILNKYDADIRFYIYESDTPKKEWDFEMDDEDVDTSGDIVYPFDLEIKEEDYIPDMLIMEIIDALLSNNKNFQYRNYRTDHYNSPIHVADKEGGFNMMREVNNCLLKYHSKIRVIVEGEYNKPIIKTILTQ